MKEREWTKLRYDPCDAIVLVSESVVRRGPMDQSQSAFTARDGAELTVLSRDGDWLEVSDASRQLEFTKKAEATDGHRLL
jgi:hypothetical protein